MEINIEDHISSEEMKAIAIEQFSLVCAEAYRTDHERILSNTAYHIVMAEADKIIDGDIVEIITKKTVELIDDLSQYCVFNRKSLRGEDDSAGVKVMDKAVKENAALINEKVVEAISNISKDDVIDNILDADFEIKFNLRDKE